MKYNSFFASFMYFTIFRQISTRYPSSTLFTIQYKQYIYIYIYVYIYIYIKEKKKKGNKPPTNLMVTNAFCQMMCGYLLLVLMNERLLSKPNKEHNKT